MQTHQLGVQTLNLFKVQDSNEPRIASKRQSPHKKLTLSGAKNSAAQSHRESFEAAVSNSATINVTVPNAAATERETENGEQGTTMQAIREDVSSASKRMQAQDNHHVVLSKNTGMSADEMEMTARCTLEFTKLPQNPQQQQQQQQHASNNETSANDYEQMLS